MSKPLHLNIWADEANCRDLKTMDSEGNMREILTDDFYPEKKGPAVFPPELRAACNTCPVQHECAEWGIHYEDHGFWGGMTTYQRAHERARRKIYLQAPEYGQREIFH